jgi:hypothetical protein
MGQNELRRALEDDVPFICEFYYPFDRRWYEAQGFPSSPSAVLVFKDIPERKTSQPEANIIGS